MTPEEIEITLNKSTPEDIARHLLKCDTRFDPPLSSRVSINEYAARLSENAVTFEAFFQGELSALVAVYLNRGNDKEAFISNVSVVEEMEGCGVARRLMNLCIEHTKNLGFRVMALEVSENNGKAVNFYTRHGFIAVENKSGLIQMKLNL